jgi:PKD domain/Secretion system C-terminal sorting domain
MKTLTLSLLLCLGSTSFAQIGTPFVNDICNDLLFSKDGSFISCGSKGPNGSVYKTDCSGAIVAQIEKGFPTGRTSFSAAVELADGSIVAVGSAFVDTGTDTLEEVLLLKTDANLVEIASTHFQILNKSALATSVTLSKTGHLLLVGNVAGVSIDFYDLFFQRVSPVTLQPTSAPVIFNHGVDLPAKIIPLTDDNFLISGSSFLGNIFNPAAPLTNRLIAKKVDDNGVQQWHYQYEKIFLAANGVTQTGGAAQNPLSTNILLCGNAAGDSTGLDPIFILLNINGQPLDTAVTDVPETQFLSNVISHSTLPGLFTAIGYSENPGAGTPNLFGYQTFELANAFFQTNAINDTTVLASVPDLVEYQPDRIAFALSYPDNPIVLGSKNYLVLAPDLEVDALYENCVLYAIDPVNGPPLTPGLRYEWYLNGNPIPNSNTQEYMPSGSGEYYVVVTDEAGCSAFSEPLSVSYLSAGFTYVGNNLNYSFTNTSNEADTYLWNFGDASTSIQVNPTHTYSIPGVYTVVLTATNDCGTATYTQVVSAISATEEQSAFTSFQLSPNPSHGLLNVDISGEANETLQFMLFSLGGKNVFSETTGFQNGALKKSFDFSHLPAGMYMLQVQAGTALRYAKVVLF